ncbi:MAG: DEAD/DEAH box helicase [Candidatus Fraserbacteria bacterium RBG_16_55_9]|uniref:DEAD/DEAH box helicase n=1 Tax=Fraserbacteria sp. (strain RBG_16_55_9) TaxID=1817864 RepID=A0A1F5UTV9_FRAXR|nr:MAG: DEAD/DEAH box helicase [Candidatus Fraserbacteria bacterium RBG_16_55_9]
MLKTIENFLGELQRRNPRSIVCTQQLPEVPPRFAQLRSPLPESLSAYLEDKKLSLYAHQVETIEQARVGTHVVMTTPTASGKSLAFNLAVFERLYKNPDATALYLYPLKALTQDQLQAIHRLEAGTGIQAHAAIYDGDTPQHVRQLIRDESRVVLTNPYALHQYLPWHHKWRRFFKNLQFVILDESHTYRGIFGSNVALLMRRLRRIAEHYGAQPQFILSSATMANPQEHSEKLVGLNFQVVAENGAARGARHFLFWNSIADASRSVHRQTSDLLAQHVKSGLQALCFTISRKLAELIALWAKEQGPDGSIAAYRAGYSPEERRQIEKALREGELRGVASTSALELGIDIGGLDAVIISGYPGTVISTWQMAGRAGRGRESAMVTLIGFENPLDQYFMKHPSKFFERPHEHAIIDLENPHILLGHAMCAAAELPIKLERGERYFGESLSESLKSLERQKLIQKTPAGWVYRGMARPVEVVSLDHISERAIQVLHEGEVLETLELRRAYEEAHTGAVLLHRGESFLVKMLDLEAGVAHVVREDVDYYTDVMQMVDIRIRKERLQRKTTLGTLSMGDVRVMERFHGYRVKRHDRTLGLHGLELPALEFETVALWFTLPEEFSSNLRAEGLDWAGGLHAAEHALIAMTPYHAMCDRWDIGGMSTPTHPDTKSATIFIYDGYQGGIGIAEKAFHLFQDLVQTTYELVRDCGCEDGCPSCIYSPKCGNNNESIDKRAAVKILDGLLP